MNLKILQIILLLFFTGFVRPVCGQDEVNVVTKIIKKNLKSINKTLIIKGEKSTINIVSWEKDYYGVELKLISKNTNKKQAETDLNIIQYEIVENQNDYSLKNYFGSDKFGNVKSNLSVVYSIKMPKNVRFDISNIYGNVYLSNINASGKLSNSFGETHLSNISGNYTINAYYSDLYVKDVNMVINCTSDKSDIEMVNVSGTIMVNANYGKISFSPGNELVNLQVDAKRTTVFLNDFDLNAYNYSLTTKSSGIALPESWKAKLVKQDGNVLFNQNSGANKPFIKIQTSYCQITIKNN